MFRFTTSSIIVPTSFAIALLAGCSGGAIPGSESTLVYGRGKDSVTLDPGNAEDGESSKVILNLYDTLVTYHDETAEIVPSLATEWSHDEERLEWRFRLRENVRFHDGTTFDANAVAFTFDRLRNPAEYGIRSPYRAHFQVIDEVEILEPYEVVFRLKQPQSVFLANLAMFNASIVSPKAVKEHGTRFDANPVGTGPFRFVEWASGERIVLQAFADHWRGSPSVETVIFEPVEEMESRLRQLRTGEIDIADGLSPLAVERIRKSKDLSLLEAPGWTTAYLAMNNRKPPFDDPSVRRAIAHAIDKEEIRRNAYEDQGVIARTIVPPSMWGSHSGIENYAHDPELARKLLREAGIAKGTTVDLWYMPNPRPYMPQPQKVAAIIEQQLRAVGFEVELRSPPWQQYLEQVGNGEHSICLLGWQTDNADPDNFLYSLLDKDNAVPPHANNVAFYTSEEVHALLVEAQTEGDQDRREELYLRAQEIIHEDCPSIPLMHRDLSAGLSARVRGYLLHPTGMVRLRNVTLADSGD